MDCKNNKNPKDHPKTRKTYIIYRNINPSPKNTQKNKAQNSGATHPKKWTTYPKKSNKNPKTQPEIKQYFIINYRIA